MRPILLPICAVATIGAMPATGTQPDTPNAMMPGYSRPAQQWPNIEQALSEKQCADRIEQVRDAADQPKLDRTPASPEAPMLIAAVDKRIDGCAVLQMKDDVNDLRPAPLPSEGPVRFQPAR